MTTITMPEFLDHPEMAWVKCEAHSTLPGQEIACTVPRLEGGTELVIAQARFFDAQRQRISAMLIGLVGAEGRLVDFPSGDRLLVHQGTIEP